MLQTDMKTQKNPEVATGTKLATIETSSPVTNKLGFARRWGICLRSVDILLSKGMPHCKVGSRMVRINVEEADKWMNIRFHTARNGRVEQ